MLGSKEQMDGKMACTRSLGEINSFERASSPSYAYPGLPALQATEDTILRPVLSKLFLLLYHSVKKVACHPKPWRRMVEAMGIEPMSALRQTQSTTCLVIEVTCMSSQ